MIYGYFYCKLYGFEIRKEDLLVFANGFLNVHRF